MNISGFLHLFLNKLRPREKMFAFMIGLLLVAWLLENLIFKPARGFSSHWAAKVRGTQGQLNKARRLMAQGPAIDREYEAYLPFFRQTQGADSTSSPPEEATMSLLLAQIESTAGQIPLPVLEIKPQKVKQPDFYNDFSIGLVIEEEFEKVYRFLYDIQNVPFLFNVEELRLEKNPLKESFVKCTLILTKRLIRDNTNP